MFLFWFLYPAPWRRKWGKRCWPYSLKCTSSANSHFSKKEQAPVASWDMALFSGTSLPPHRHDKASARHIAPLQEGETGNLFRGAEQQEAVPGGGATASQALWAYHHTHRCPLLVPCMGRGKEWVGLIHRSVGKVVEELQVGVFGEKSETKSKDWNCRKSETKAVNLSSVWYFHLSASFLSLSFPSWNCVAKSFAFLCT